ncbi:hypothetical protein [Kosakonia sp. MUSA4]|nr:hypothetical protein C0557_11595 [Kosakonia sp. MUSA4]
MSWHRLCNGCREMTSYSRGMSNVRKDENNGWQRGSGMDFVCLY